MSNQPDNVIEFDPANKADRTRISLMLAGSRIFGEKGLGEATVREIAQEAGQNVASITYYFGGKEGLYESIIVQHMKTVRRMMEPLMDEAENFLDNSPTDGQRAINYITDILRAMFENIVNREETLAFSRIMLREQMQPTDSFEVIYEAGGIRWLQETLTRLLEVITGEAADSYTNICRAHSLTGQVLCFRCCRETIRRHLEIPSDQVEKFPGVSDVIADQTRLMLLGLMAENKARNSATN